MAQREDRLLIIILEDALNFVKHVIQKCHFIQDIKYAKNVGRRKMEENDIQMDIWYQKKQRHSLKENKNSVKDVAKEQRIGIRRVIVHLVGICQV